MYVDLIILIALLIFVIVYSRKMQNYIFGIASIDIFFRVLSFIKNNIPISGVKGQISKYVPESIPGMIDKYTSSNISILLMWGYVIIMAIFLFFSLKIFIKRKKI